MRILNFDKTNIVRFTIDFWWNTIELINANLDRFPRFKWQGQLSSTCKAMVDHNDPRTREKVMYHNLPPNLSPKLYNYENKIVRKKMPQKEAVKAIF